MENNSFRQEAEEYFSHNPQDKKVGFAIISGSQMETIENEGITIYEDYVCFTVENKNWKLSIVDYKRYLETAIEYLGEISGNVNHSETHSMILGKLNDVLSSIKRS